AYEISRDWSSDVCSSDLTYQANGNYTATLTVQDPGGKTASVALPIVVGNTRPEVTFEAPPDGGFINLGDEVDYTVTVTDAEDGRSEERRVGKEGRSSGAP